MLKKYISLQREQLDNCSLTMRQHQQLLQTEQQREQQLQHYLQTLNVDPAQRNLLLRQNSEGMQQQLQTLVQSQQALIRDAEQALVQSQQTFRQQYARVKGLEQLHTQREAQQQQREERKLRNTLDDLACYRFTTLTHR